MIDCESFAVIKGQADEQEPSGQERTHADRSALPAEQWKLTQRAGQAEGNFGLWASLAGGGRLPLSGKGQPFQVW